MKNQFSGEPRFPRTPPLIETQIIKIKIKGGGHRGNLGSPIGYQNLTLFLPLLVGSGQNS